MVEQEFESGISRLYSNPLTLAINTPKVAYKRDRNNNNYKKGKGKQDELIRTMNSYPKLNLRICLLEVNVDLWFLAGGGTCHPVTANLW